MGIYYDHGVEYIVVTKNHKYTIVPLKDADKRLEASEYYKERKDSWFNEGSSFRRPIEGEIDIELTESEKDLLESVLKVHESNVESHGWYDVQYLYDTYGF